MKEDIFGIIARRKSSRTYSGLLPGEDILNSIRRGAAAPLPSQAEGMLPAGTPEPCIRLLEQSSGSTPPSTYGVVKGARLFAAMGLSKEHSRAETVAGGILFEQFILRATALGMATCWLGGTFGRSSFQALFEKAGGTGEVAIVSPVGHEAPSMRFGERLMRAAVRASKRKPFGKLFTGVNPPEQFPPSLPLPSSAGMPEITASILEAVRLAPSSSNSQPWRATVAADGDRYTVSLTCASPDGRFAPVDMGIALCHIILGAEALGVAVAIDSADFDALAFTLSISRI